MRLMKIFHPELNDPRGVDYINRDFSSIKHRSHDWSILWMNWNGWKINLSNPGKSMNKIISGIPLDRL